MKKEDLIILKGGRGVIDYRQTVEKNKVVLKCVPEEVEEFEQKLAQYELQYSVRGNCYEIEVEARNWLDVADIFEDR